MYHFANSYSSPGPSGLGSSSKIDKHTSLNATQQKSESNPFFLAIEEELHDARRVQSHGQEDDLRSALDMVIKRVSELSTMLSEVYKTQADLEVQLNVTRSNLQLVQSNNEMLEEALKRNNAAARDVGWRRGNAPQSQSQSNLERSQSVDYAYDSASPPPSATTDNRFFKFRFNSSTSSAPTRASSRPGTPSNAGAAHLTSPSLPSLSSTHAKELEDMAAELEKERAAKKAVIDEKAALEAELESLSQALFEEANKMVAQERMKRSETEEELKELKLEKQALQSALKLLHAQQQTPQSQSSEFSFEELASPSRSTHSRSSSQVGLKSRPDSLDLSNSLPPLPPSPFPDTATSTSPAPSPAPEKKTSSPPPRSSSLPQHHSTTSNADTTITTSTTTKPTATRPSSTAPAAAPLELVSPTRDVEDGESQPTPRYNPPSLHASTGSVSLPPMEEASPWADMPSSSSAMRESFGAAVRMSY